MVSLVSLVSLVYLVSLVCLVSRTLELWGRCCLRCIMIKVAGYKSQKGPMEEKRRLQTPDIRLQTSDTRPQTERKRTVNDQREEGR